MTTMDRRTLLLGSAGLLLAGCGGGGKPSTKDATPTGPVIVKPRTGNVVTPADTTALRDRLNQAYRSGDAKEMAALIHPGDYSVADFEKRWRRRFDNFERLGVVDGEWYVGAPTGRTRNGSGGVVEYSGDLVFAHTVKGCDAQQVVESARADFRKKSEDAPLELMSVGAVEQDYDPSIWDVAEIDLIETEHAYVVYRLTDVKRAKAFAGRIEEGAKKAFGLMPRPQGVDKLFYVLTWPAVQERLYGGLKIGEASAAAYYHPFLDPEQLSKGQKTFPDRAGLPRATGRIGLFDETFSRSDFVEVACHEGVHVLADQWYVSSPPTWIVEGLAEWGAKGTAGLMAREGGRIRASFAAFEAVAPREYEDFHSSPREYDFYQCAAAVYAYLDDTEGRDAVFETARAFYGADDRVEGAKKLGRSEKDLIAATRKWLAA